MKIDLVWEMILEWGLRPEKTWGKNRSGGQAWKKLIPKPPDIIATQPVSTIDKFFSLFLFFHSADFHVQRDDGNATFYGMALSY